MDVSAGRPVWAATRRYGRHDRRPARSNSGDHVLDATFDLMEIDLVMQRVAGEQELFGCWQSLADRGRMWVLRIGPCPPSSSFVGTLDRDRGGTRTCSINQSKSIAPACVPVISRHAEDNPADRRRSCLKRPRDRCPWGLPPPAAGRYLFSQAGRCPRAAGGLRPSRFGRFPPTISRVSSSCSRALWTPLEGVAERAVAEVVQQRREHRDFGAIPIEVVADLALDDSRLICARYGRRRCNGQSGNGSRSGTRTPPARVA